MADELADRRPGRGAGRRWQHWLGGLASAALAIGALSSAPAFAAGVPTGFQDRQIYSGFTSPTALHTLPDGRVLVVQQNGVIRLIKDDVLLATPFYMVQNVDPFVETGCVGVVSDPGFMSNGHVYFYCTLRNNSESHNRILRVTAQGDTASPASEVTILDLPVIPPDPMDGSRIYTHIGGAMRFGSDGKLYVATGGHENTRVRPSENSYSQRMDSPFGKLLRINPDGSFPADNPFYNTAGAYRGVYSLGLRNPFGMDIQEGTGRIFVNDVGAGSFEEVIDAKPGENYGWPAYDGNSSEPQYVNGFYVYPHAEDSSGRFRCALTGSAFYDPLNAQFPGSYVGKYLFADYCSGSVYTLDPIDPSGDTEFVTGIVGPVGLSVAPDGSLYYLARHTTRGDGDGDEMGLLGKVEYTGTQAPNIAQHPQSQTVFLGQPASFSVVAEGATSMQWRRNGANIPGATGSTYTIPGTVMADNGAVFTVVTQNGFGSTTSNPATLTVTTNNLPQVSITSPTADTEYYAGMQLNYAGTASDAEDGTLPDSAFRWQANFHHDTHTHPFIQATDDVRSGSVVVPDFETTTANTWTRFILSATDSAGQTQTVTRDIYPRHQLSGLNPSGTPVNGSGPIELDRHNGGSAAGDGGTMVLNSIAYPKGLGMHAPAEVIYALGGSCDGRLIADVGIDDSVGDAGSVVFQVFVDGANAFDSGLMRGSDARRAVNVDLSGAQQVRLVVTDGGDGNAQDRANWGGARAMCSTLPQDTLGGAGPDLGPGAPIASPSGGGGCTTGSGTRFDPTLAGLAVVALIMLLVRRRRTRS